MRTRRLTAILAAGLLAVVAGCGGDDSSTPQVPGAPADMTIQSSGDSPTEAAASAQDRNSNDDTSTSTDDSSTSTDSSGSTDTGSTDSSGGTTGDTSAGADGGTAAPDTQTDSPTNDTAPPAGSNAEEFEDFCAQNPGAC